MEDYFRNYGRLFIERIPKYAVKIPGKRWRTKNKPLSDVPVKAHLNGQYYIGVLGQWYPKYAIMDFDSREFSEVKEIRSNLGLSDGNSMLLSSESQDSYHILIKPQFNNEPPSLRLLKNAFCNFALRNGIEIYPQAKRIIRLPFGLNQNCLDRKYYGLENWENKLSQFNKLDDFDLSCIKYQQLELDFSIDSRGTVPSILEEGGYLLENGLQKPSSRHSSQFKVLYYLWRQNKSLAQAVNIVYDWIRKKHNGYSEDIVRYPGRVRNEILRQAGHIYSKYEFCKVYPDSTHNNHNGFITEQDIRKIIKICQASMPRMKFLFNIVKYSYPRRYRTFLSVHTNKLINWSSHKTYYKYLNELEEKGIATRGQSYSSGFFSKNLKLNWRYKDSGYVLCDRRSINSFKETIKILYKPRDFRDLLKEESNNKGYISRIIKNIYDSS